MNLQRGDAARKEETVIKENVTSYGMKLVCQHNAFSKQLDVRHAKRKQLSGHSSFIRYEVVVWGKLKR